MFALVAARRDVAEKRRMSVGTEAARKQTPPLSGLSLLLSEPDLVQHDARVASLLADDRRGVATPADAAAMRLFREGAEALRSGRPDPAAIGLAEAVTRCPGFGPAWTLLGLALGLLDLPNAALACQVRAVRLAPALAEAHHNFAAASHRVGGASPGALAASREAVRLQPGFAAAWVLLGRMLLERHRPDDALAALDRGLAASPNLAEGHRRRGAALMGCGRAGDAVAAWCRAVELQPDDADSLANLCGALGEIGRLDDAIAVGTQAVSLRPDHADAVRNLGVALHTVGRFTEALAAYRQAHASRADPELLILIGTACDDLNRADEAIAALDAAVAALPGSADAHFNRGLCLLRAGRWREGWADHEWRWQGLLPPHGIAAPAWTGEALEGRPILLHAEQGLGDTLHFARYAPMVAEAGGTVVLEVQAPLVRLMRTLPGVRCVIASGAPRPEVARHCSLMSLPHRFNTAADSVPNAPYLVPDPADADRWRERLARWAGPKVGLVWAGSARPGEVRSHHVDRRRSLRAAQLAPLASVPGVHWFRLQIGAAAGEAPPGLVLHDLTGSIADMADTAAMIAALDLVVTVDTSVAHLAGGMGKAVWMLSRFDGCWRWGAAGATTPWYPAMRIYRQPAPGDWDAVIDQLAKDLGSRFGPAA